MLALGFEELPHRRRCTSRNGRGRGRHAWRSGIGSREYNIEVCRTSEAPLLILSLDTTTRGGSVAVVRDGTVLAETTGDSRITHGERLPRDLMRALDAAGVRLDDVELLAVVTGPGSFTGLRVGIAAMQGLAVSRRLKIVPVSTLDALAREAADSLEGDALIAPWVDAQRGEVYAALFAPGLDVSLAAPSSATPRQTLAAWSELLRGRHVLFAGDGAVRYRDVIDEALGARARILGSVPLLAARAARIAEAESPRAVLPHAVVPIYVRRPDAEIARDRSRSETQA